MADPKNVTIVIKKVTGHGGHPHHGGAWKVAYADFVTAMMAFFLVMWLMGSDEETKAQIAHYFNHPNTPYSNGRDPASTAVHPMGELTGEGDSILVGLGGMNPDDLIPNPARSDLYFKQYKEFEELLQEILKEQIFAIDLNLDYLKFSILESNVFIEGTNHFRTDAHKYLDPIGRILSNFKGYVVIEEHTNNYKINGVQLGSLYEASVIKAVTVMDYLVEKQWISETRITPVGSGDKKKYTADESGSKSEQNQRIEFVLSHEKKF